MTLKRRIVIAAAAAGLALAAVAVYLSRPRGGPDFGRLRGGRDLNVILVTLDTTRADRLGCYGFRNVETPTIDLFASRGVRFERCYAQTPLTLPSHTTLMTGTLPLFHGVRDNGGFVVPSPLVTMAELFKDRGYATGAFIAAYVLDSKWGLDQGFDTYFDKFDLGKFKRISLGTVQRPANEVMAEALPWLERNKGGKFFAWIHLYDPHSPYDPPPPYDKLYAAHPYLGEIAFADSQLRRLWELLETNGLDRNTVIVAGRGPRREPRRARRAVPRVLRLSGGHPRPPDRRHALFEVPGRRRLGGRGALRRPADGLRYRRASPSRPRSRGTAWSRPSRAARRTAPGAGLQRDLLSPVPLRLVGPQSRPGREVQAHPGSRPRALRRRRRPARGEESRLPPEGRL